MMNSVKNVACTTRDQEIEADQVNLLESNVWKERKEWNIDENKKRRV